MRVRRIVPNLHAKDPAALAEFYRALLGLEGLMEMSFIQTLGAGDGPVELTVASEGGGGTPLPAVSIEVDDLDEAHRRAVELGAPVEHGPVIEPWGVRRFFLRDPDGNLVNILSH